MLTLVPHALAAHHAIHELVGFGPCLAGAIREPSSTGGAPILIALALLLVAMAQIRHGLKPIWPYLRAVLFALLLVGAAIAVLVTFVIQSAAAP